jgi:CRP-like cAMP-binding protein
MAQPLIEDNLAFFKRVSLFHDLNESQIKKIMKIMTIKEVKKGDMITREGEHGDNMFILLKGQVEISKSLFLSPLSSGDSLQEKSLIKLNEDEHAFFGEMALFLDNPERSASICALRSCTLATIQKRELKKILDDDHSLGSIFYKNISKELTKRLIKANRDILKLTTAFSLALEGE